MPVQSDGRTWLRKLQTGCGESLMKLGCLRHSVTMGLPKSSQIWYGVVNSKLYLIKSLGSADNC